jgi:flavin-dependent dehydrogenase
MERYDVIVVGAGLAGLQCARLLGRQGVKILLVDRKQNLTESIHTTGIFVRRTLEDFDLPDDCLGPPIRHVTLYSPARRALNLNSPHAEFRVGKMDKLYSRYLDHCRGAGVVWLPNTRYAGHRSSRNGVVVQLDHKSQTRLVQARFIVAADGANSRVARDLKLDVNNDWIVGLEDVITGVPLEGPPRLHCFLEPKLAPGYLAWVAHDGEELHIGVGGYASSFEPSRALGIFKASLSSIVDLRNARQVERRGGRIPVGGVLRNIVNQKGLLIGDAAGAVSPLTAGGLDPCMRLSTFAARVISEFLESGDPQVLNAYSGNLFRARFASRLWMRRILATIKTPTLMELGCALVRIPPFDGLAWHVFFGRGSFPDTDEYLAPEPVTQV